MLVQFCAFDRHYLEQLRRGDLVTGEHFADYFGRLIRLRLGSRLNSKVTFEDIRQETFLRVWMALHKDDGIRQPERFGAFVSSVCNNVLREHRRRTGKEDQAEDDSFASLPDSGIPVPEIIASEESRLHIGRVLAKLPAKTRNLIQRVFLDECDKDEVCRELRVDRQYYRVLLHRALRQFKRQYLKEMRGEDCLPPARHPSRGSSQASVHHGHGAFKTSCSLTRGSGKGGESSKNAFHSSARSQKPRVGGGWHFPSLCPPSSSAAPDESLHPRLSASGLS